VTQPYTRPIAEADWAFAAEKTAQTLRVFVAGPIISRDWTPEEWANARASSRLRLSVKDHIESLGHSVILGEHRGVKEMADQAIPSTPSAVVSETFLAARSCHCIIMIPDSPGSFCELGAWAHHKDVASKMLILGHNEYEHQTSYVNPSVFALASTFGARIRWVDYSTFEAARPELDKFISLYQERAFIQKVMHGSGS
jgi:hypothetical protein